MSYAAPIKGQNVVVVDEHGGLKTAAIEKVVEVGGEGKVEVGGKVLRYVDPAGATQYTPGSWHFPKDDTSAIVKSAPERVRAKPDVSD